MPASLSSNGRIYEWDLAIIDIMLKDKDDVVDIEVFNDLCPDEVIYLLDEFKYEDIKFNVI